MPRKERTSHGKGSLGMAAIIIVSTALAAYILSLFDFFGSLEYKLYDLNFQLRGPYPVNHSDIVIVAIDQETADSLSFPFNRCHYADLIDQLNLLGAKLIVFDIDFSSNGIIPESDVIFKEAIARADNVVLQGKVSYRYQKGLKEPVADTKSPVLAVASPETPWGLVNELVDGDGVTRRYALFLPRGEKWYLSLGLKLYQLLNGLEDEIPTFNRRGDFHFGNLDIPRFGDVSSTLLDYYGPAGTFPTYSFVSVIRGDYNFAALLSGLSSEEAAALAESGMAGLLTENPFKNKIIFIGASAEDLQDNKFTPFFTARNPRKTPGVEVHANALQAFLDGHFLRAVGFWWIVVGVLLIGVVVYFATRFFPHWFGFLTSGAILLAITLAGFMLFQKYGLWLAVVPLLLTVIISYPSNLVYRFVLAQREKAMIRGMFSQYIPKKVVDELIANPEKAKLGGERRRMSVIFTDIAGFSTVSEKLQPEELIHLLNEYLTALSLVIVDHDGIIDKYEGDLIMAEFGAPIWIPDHAARACRASLGMQRRLAELRLKWRQEGKNELYSRVGVNTGDMIIGNMGSEQAFDYTVMGDSVNLASRLEGANKAYGSTIMIGKNTYDDVKDLFVTRPLDFLRVKGKTEPVEVFELLAEKWEELTPEKQKCVEIYREAMAKYRTLQFREAGELFGQAEEMDPTDGPSKVYHERSAQNYLEPPPPDWDMVWELHEK